MNYGSKKAYIMSHPAQRWKPRANDEIPDPVGEEPRAINEIHPGLEPGTCSGKNKKTNN